MLKQFDIYYNKEFVIESLKGDKTYPRLVAQKRIWADNEEMAIKIGECIAFHDSEVWHCTIDYDYIDVMQC